MPPNPKEVKVAGLMALIWIAVSWPLTALLVFIQPMINQGSWIGGGTGGVPAYVWLLTGLPAMVGVLIGIIVTIMGARAKVRNVVGQGITSIVLGVFLLAGT